MRKRVIVPVLAIFLAAALAAPAGRAEPVWICAITGSSAAQDDGTTGPLDTGGQPRPTFLRVDPNARKVTILAPAARRGETSAIQTMQKEEQGWVLAGVEKGKAWSMIIAEDGAMTMAATGDGVVWSIFGHSVVEADLAPPESRPGGTPASGSRP